MMERWTILESENGWVVTDAMSHDPGATTRSWVADYNEQLGKLIERLANEAEQEGKQQ